MRPKPFSHELYNDWDDSGKNVIIDFFAERNLKAIPNPDSDYVVDMYVYNGDKLVAYAEAEVRQLWNTSNFYFDTIHIPYRKKKYLQHDLPTFYFVINSMGTYAFVIMAENILKSPVKVMSNKFQKKEMFFDVSKNKAKLYKLKKGMP